MPDAPLVYIVDDDEAVRDSLSIMFEERGYAVQVFATAPEFLAAAPNLLPGCLVVDIRMPDMDGLELQQRLVAGGLTFPLIIMTGHADVPLAVRAMKAGALDFIEKPLVDQVCDSVALALQRIREAPVRDRFAVDAAEHISELTSRECEVLAGLLAGLPNKAIAYDLAISPRTVEIHRAHIMDKMKARSLPELVRMSIAAGLQPKSQQGSC